MERYVVISKWDEFQHYKGQERPKWIKCYTKLMQDDDYLSLSPGRALILHRLWLEYAASSRRLRADTADLTRRLALRVTTSDLKALSDAGFIRLCSRTSLEKLKRSSIPEVEVDIEEETPFIPLLEEPPKNGYKPAVELGDEEARQRVAAELRRASKEWGRIA